MSRPSSRITVIDTHTAGEPTRVVISGGPDLGPGTMAERVEVFRDRFDAYRSAIVNEPRGSDVMVGALLCEPLDPSCAAGVIYFNNVGYLGMCGHGTIGVAVALGHLGRIATGIHAFETPVGVVAVDLQSASVVEIENVASRRSRKGVTVRVPGIGDVVGDVAWGGNWFFLVEDHGEALRLGNVDRLTDLTWRIRLALAAEGVRGDDGGEVDHVELHGPATVEDADGKNFVLCPGRAYDRSPCGTGTSARMACLHADGLLVEGRAYRQEGFVGGVFEGSVRVSGGSLRPRIRGTAYVNAESTLILDRDDPFCWGIRS